MRPEVTTYRTVLKAADILAVSPYEVDLLTQAGALDSITIDGQLWVAVAGPTPKEPA